MEQNIVEPVSREEFAEFVLNMRNSLGMSRQDFGKLSGIPPITLTSWETQYRYPRCIDQKIKKIRETVKSEIRRRRTETT